MLRDITSQTRDEKLDELTANQYHQLRQKLQGGNADLAHTIDDAISHEMDGAFWRQAVVDAAGVEGAHIVGLRIKKLVEKALLAEAEIAALKELEQLEAADDFEVPDVPVRAAVRGPWNHAGRI